MNGNAKFSEGFFWGAAASAHQVEGGNANDWSEWEKSEARTRDLEFRIKDENFKKNFPPHLFEKRPAPSDLENYISGKACDHYNRFEEDFNIAKSLGHNAHRFSVEWSRIEPEEGKFSEKEIAHYRMVVKALKERGLEPFMTLWHWPLPLWLRDKGGWQNSKTPAYFRRYAEKIVSEFKGDVKFWITLNEPEIYASISYLKGVWPPQKKNPLSYLAVMGNLIRAHRGAYEIIKKIRPEAQVGIAKNNIYFEAAENKIINRALKKIIDWWWNFYFLNKIKNHSDFIGLNHYFHNLIKNCRFNQNENKKVSDMGWELYPEAIYHCLIDLKKYRKPIYVTESGLADAKDEKRSWFIRETLKNVRRAMEEGADVRGYFYWSLLDNFEWDKGFWPRFGLAEVDYETLERKIRPSALEYAKIIKDDGDSQE